jgi:Fic family protein
MRLVGRWEGLQAPRPQPKLRRENQIRTIRGTLAIEGNTLSPDRVTAILDHRRVVGSKREVLEVKNAIATYERAHRYAPESSRDLLDAHRALMNGLVADAGRYPLREAF